MVLRCSRRRIDRLEDEKKQLEKKLEEYQMQQ